MRAGKVAVHRDAFTPDISYPLVFVPEEATRFVAPEIILGLSRQESEFNPRAFSRAGARGVMQLIPSTAQLTARKEGLAYSRSALLDDPVYNMTLGSAHLSHLLARYDGSLVMTLAAYNAGPHRVTRWVDEYGDPRSPGVDPIDWVEHIPFSETRNYVQRVLENVQVYRGRLNEAAIPGRLAADLEQGGPQNRIATDAAPSNVVLISGRPAASVLPPPPARTVEKAQRYAQLITQTAPAASPEAGPEFGPEPGAAPPATDEPPGPEQDPAQAQQDAINRSVAAPETSPAPPSQAPVALTPEQTAARIETEEEIKAEAEAAPPPVIQSDAEQTAETPVIAETAAPQTAAPQTIDARPVEQAVTADASAPPPAAPSAADPSAPAEPERRVIRTAYDFLPPWPGTENDAENETAPAAPTETGGANAQTGSGAAVGAPAQATISSFQDTDGTAGFGQETPETDPCLAYRAFLARNAEEGVGAADLNASMLNELRAGRRCE